MIEKSNIGKIFIISGPSGVGKDVVVAEVRRILKKNNIYMSIPMSYTTREKRDDDSKNSNYKFVTESDFFGLLKDDILEHTKSHGNFYGMSKNSFEEEVKSGQHILKILDQVGAATFQKFYPSNSVLIYLKPPSLQVLADRLTNRNSESPSSYIERMNDSIEEMKNVDNYDYVIKNHNLSKTASLIYEIIRLSL